MDILMQGTLPGFQSRRIDTTEIPDARTIETELARILEDSEGPLREMCSHILNAGGKRIRPLLVLYSGLIFSGPSRELMLAALSAELIHMASLVHDDIIDRSALRKGRPSVNQVWGNHMAVLCGDYLFSRAFGILSSHRLIRSMDYMVEAISNMCHGEILQASARFSCETDTKRYYDCISRKTAIFLACCCKSGAAAAGASDIHIQILGEYGRNLGFAFQIIDDLLDLCGNSEVMGKPGNEDLTQGILTLPVLLLMEVPAIGEQIRERLQKGALEPEEVEGINRLVCSSDVVERSYRIAQGHIEKAEQCLNLLPESRNTELLRGLAGLLQSRMN